ncbi:MAG TPA: AAC(3) family N-acetyltransferase [Anaerolineae bacterium]|nr:AAC(3) family N-acetyltransferase [Anaerolineae bacterium]HIQ04939.1 AAC(3) family N-acetyltransferase [Anaerolineae bacterium]
MDHRIDIDETVPLRPVSCESLIIGLRLLGLRAGDRVIAHASLSSFGIVEGGARTVIEAILTVLGPSGTLMMPYFFSPFYEGLFDPGNPPPTTCGAVPRLLRTWPGAVLSLHPSHPVIAIGADAERLTEGHYRVSSVGKDSPVDRTAKMGGKVLLLGVNQWVNTTIHTGEAYAGVPYWGRPRPDRFRGRWMIMPDGQKTWVPLRETPGDSAGFHKIEPFLIERGLITFGLIGRARCRLMPGQRLIDAVVEFLRRDPSGLLCDRTDCTFCPWARQFLPEPYQSR